MTPGFGARLLEAQRRHGAVCVGIDPHAALLTGWGLNDDVRGLEAFASTCVEAFAGRAAAVKPQAAFFERFGAAGMAVLEWTVQQLRAAGTLVILDVKRGDIGSTARAYADAYLDPGSPLCADAVTVSPFLGFGSLTPFLEVAEAHGHGVFVLALTSNPEGPEVQRARTGEGATVAGTVLGQVAARNAGAAPIGSIGVVVGATIGETGEDLAINGPILVPGVGAQGGTAADVRRLFGEGTAGVLPAVSRSVLGAGPTVAALREAAARANATFSPR